jgi:CBS domain-containing protein
MLVKHVMSTAPACCSPDTNLGAVAKLMLEHDCGEIPICDGTKLVGVITDRDIACRGFLTGKNPLDVPVKDVMTRTVFTISPDDPIDLALDEMEKYQVRRLPVVDHSGKVIGMVSQADVVGKVPPAKAVELLKAISKKVTPAMAL